MPAIVHVVELTQPQGHSTSGSHERYKSDERLAWEHEYDCLRKMREWILAAGLADAAELDAGEEEDRRRVREAQRAAWAAYREPIDRERAAVVSLCDALAAAAADPAAAAEVGGIARDLEKKPAPFRRDLLAAVADALVAARREDLPARRRAGRLARRAGGRQRGALLLPPVRRGRAGGGAGGGGGAGLRRRRAAASTASRWSTPASTPPSPAVPS